jgi:hypothetical protein
MWTDRVTASLVMLQVFFSSKTVAWERKEKCKSSKHTSPSWDANRRPVTQDIPSTLWNPRVYSRVHKRFLLVPTLVSCVAYSATLKMERHIPMKRPLTFNELQNRKIITTTVTTSNHIISTSSSHLCLGLPRVLLPSVLTKTSHAVDNLKSYNFHIILPFMLRSS